MQDKLSFNGVVVKQPDKDGYKAMMETTSTASSGRDMRLKMRNTPMGTVLAYELKWSGISAEDASLILKQVLNKASYMAHYFDLYEGKWKDAEFYTATINSPVLTVREGVECWEELSFQMTAINAI